MASPDHLKRIAELESANAGLQRELAASVEVIRVLREKQALLQALVDNATTVILAKDVKERYLLVNHQFETLLDVTQEEVRGKTNFDFLPREFSEAMQAADQKVLRTGQVVEVEEALPLSDGLHSFLSVKVPIRDTTGSIYAIGCVATDISARKRVEQALRDSECRHRLILDAALDAVVIMDERGFITGWNPQAEVVFGWSREDVVGRRLSDVVVPQRFRAEHESGLRRYLETGESKLLGQRIELSAVHRDGHEFPVELAITPIHNVGHIEFSAFVRDVSRRKSNESRLRSQLLRLDLFSHLARAISARQDLQSIFQVVTSSLENQLPVDFCGICLCDADAGELVVVEIGPKSLQLAQDMNLSQGTQIDVERNGLRRCVEGYLVYEPDIAGESPSFTVPHRMTRSSLRSLVLAPLWAEGRAFGVLAAARREVDAFSSGDCEFLRQLGEHVTLAARQAQLHTELQTAYDDLRETRQAAMQHERLRALGQMASGIAHDINNALSPVALYAESLLETEQNLSERGRGYLGVIVRAIGDVAATVARMREFYREREPQLTLTPVYLDQLAREAIELTRACWCDMPLQRGIVIDLRAELEPAPPAVPGLESEIREALINLIFNAVDAMPDGGALTLRTGMEAASGEIGGPARVYIEVADTGIGMDEETCKRCLEPFFTTKGERGTGLGLPMVYGIAQRHDAEIEIESAPGRGTRIRLSFAPQQDIATAALAPEPHRGVSPQNVLLIDDDALLIESMLAILELDGHRVTAASGGQQGIDLFAQSQRDGHAFSVVITDLGMPHVDGRKVAAAIKALSPATPIIMLTGWGQRLRAEDDVPEGVDDLLSKPPKLNELRAALRRCCKAAPR